MTERTDGVPAEQEARLVGQRIMERIRTEVNDEFAYFAGAEGEDVFHTLYLTPRDTAIPEHLLLDNPLLDIHMDVRELYFQVFDGIRAELLQTFGRDRGIWIAVDPSVDDHSTAILCTDDTVLLIEWRKARSFSWRSEEAMADELGTMHRQAAQRLAAQPPPPHQHGTQTGV